MTALNLIDAPTGYQEVPVAGLDGLYCADCPPGQTLVSSEPCPRHGPAATINAGIDYFALADLAELVMVTRSANGDALLKRITQLRLNPEYLITLEAWGVIGRNTANIRVTLIHEAHIGTVRELIIERRGVPGDDQPLAYLAMPPMTKQRRALIELVAEGRGNREIARALIIAEDTVKTHMIRIRAQFDAIDRTNLVHLAHLRGVFGEVPQAPARD